MVFSCQFQGHPTPKVHWSKKDTRSGSQTLSHVGPVLKIASVTPKDAGLYSCIGSNRVGQLASASARLKVLHTPDPPRVVHHVAFTNGSVLLHWRRPRHGPPVSSYSVSYTECCTAPEWTTVKVAAGGHRRTLQCVLTELKPGLDYTVNVVAHSSGDRQSVPLAFNFTTPTADEAGVYWWREMHVGGWVGGCSYLETMSCSPPFPDSLSFGLDNTSRVVIIHDIKTAIKVMCLCN